jgi:hypothetical protein
MQGILAPVVLGIDIAARQEQFESTDDPIVNHLIDDASYAQCRTATAETGLCSKVKTNGRWPSILNAPIPIISHA